MAGDNESGFVQLVRGVLDTVVRFVKFGGPIGKLALLGIVTILVLLIVAIRIDGSQLLYLAGIIVLASALFGLGIWSYAMKNPELATLEGQEVISWRQVGEFGTESHSISVETSDAMEATSNPVPAIPAESEPNASAAGEGAE